MPEASATHAIDGELTIASVSHHAPRLLEAAARSGSCLLDLSGVTHLDGAGLQLLMFAAREAARAGGGLQIAGASRAATAALSLARLDEALQPLEQPACDPKAGRP